MKSLVASFCSFLLLVGCAQTTFHVVNLDDETGEVTDIDSTKGDVGLLYYQPVPYLFVQRPLNKDGATTSKIIYLPDKANPMSMRFKGGFGSAEMSVSLTNGMISTFNQTTDSKIPELLANLATPLTGAAQAAASLATAGLTEAQEDEIRAGLEAGAEKQESVADAESTDEEKNTDRCDPSSKTWIKVPNPPNSEITPKDRERLIAAANVFACQSEKLLKASLQNQSGDALNAAKQITYIVSADYESDETKIWIQTLLEKHPVATPLRVIVKNYKAPDLGDSDPLKAIEDKLKLAHNDVIKVANRLDPPKPAKPKEPFELYKIVVVRDDVLLIPADKSTAEEAMKKREIIRCKKRTEGQSACDNGADVSGQKQTQTGEPKIKPGT